jgi:hypothetical protein
MTESPIPTGIPDVPTQVFEKFLQALTEANLSVDLITRLRKTLLQDKKFTERVLKDAVLNQEPTV